MKKTFRLEGLDCANCAAKIESQVAALEGVHAASVNFMTSKMVIEGADEHAEQIVAQALDIVKRVEPDVVVRKA